MSPHADTNAYRRSKRDIAFGLITIIISTVICLLLAEYGLRWYQRSINNSSAGDPGLLRYDSRLGWKLTPSWQGRHRHHDFDVRYSINKYGYRGHFPEALLQNNRPRIAVIGDSFSFGLGVNDDETFTARLNRQEPDIDFLNLSVPGYSTDQQLLLLKASHRRVDADEYILFVYLGNDILDNMLSWPLQVEQAKPMFVLDENHRLILNNVPVPRTPKPAVLHSQTLMSVVFADSLKDYQSTSFLSNSQLWKRLLPPQATVDRVAVFAILDRRLRAHKELMQALLSDMHDYVKSHHRRFQIALLSGRSFVLAPNSYSAYFQDYVRLFIKEVGVELNIPVIDVAGHMRDMRSSASNKWYYPNEGHLNKEGHQIVSDIVMKALERDKLTVAD